MSWKPATYNVTCPICANGITVDALSLTDIFAAEAHLVKHAPSLVYGDGDAQTRVDAELLCLNCFESFELTMTLEPADDARYRAKELDLNLAVSQRPSIRIRNDSTNRWIRVWRDANVPGRDRDFRINPLETKYIDGIWHGWVQFVTHTDPTATIITTNAPFIVDVYMYDASADRLSPGHPKTLWPQFTDGPKERSWDLDVGDRLNFITTPYAARLLQDEVLTIEELQDGTLEDTDKRLKSKNAY